MCTCLSQDGSDPVSLIIDTLTRMHAHAETHRENHQRGKHRHDRLHERHDEYTERVNFTEEADGAEDSQLPKHGQRRPIHEGQQRHNGARDDKQVENIPRVTDEAEEQVGKHVPAQLKGENGGEDNVEPPKYCYCCFVLVVIIRQRYYLCVCGLCHVHARTHALTHTNTRKYVAHTHKSRVHIGPASPRYSAENSGQ